MRNSFWGANVFTGRKQAANTCADAVNSEFCEPPFQPKRPYSAQWLILYGVLLISAIAFGTGAIVEHFRNRALANGENALANATLAIARHFDQEFEQIELVKGALDERIHSTLANSSEEFWRRMSGLDTHELMSNWIGALPLVRSLELVDVDGKLVNSSHAWPVPATNVADLEYFKAFLIDPQLTEFVSAPVRSRRTGAWEILFARRLTGTHGEFLGLVIQSIELNHFENFFASTAFSSDVTISLFHRDGTLLARYPRAEAMIGRNFLAGQKQRHLDLAADHSIARLKSPIDGLDRLASLQRLSRIPATIVATASVSAVLSDWLQLAKILLAIALLSALVVAAVVFLIVRQSLQEHQGSSRQLNIEQQRLDTAVNNMAQGLLLYDSMERLVVFNRRYTEMYGLSPDVVKRGLHFRALIQHRKETGSFAGDVDAFCSSVLRNVAQMKQTSTTVITSDGRSIQIVNQPLADGGWLTTHEDITERESLKIHLNAALNNMGQGLCFFDKSQRLVVSNSLYAEMYGLDPQRVRPTVTLKEIIDLRDAAGSAPHMSKDQYHDWRNSLLATDQSSDTVVELKNGRIVQIKHRTMPDGGWVATHEDVTEQRQVALALERANHELAERNSLLARREQELKSQNARFDAAINNMSQGLCMFDRDQRVVVCNDRYAEMYGVAPERVKLGTSLRELIEDRIAMGIYAGADRDEYLREKLAPVVSNRDEIVELSDGRILSLSARVMADGGFVTTQEDITARRQIEARVAHLAHHDGLTDLANRVQFRERLEQALLRAQRKISSVALLYLDLDRFKEVNDTLGHAVGDLVLKAVAARLHQCIRKMDLVSRLGGDEFAIVIESADAPKDAAAVATRVIDCLSEPHLIEGHQLIVGTTIGIAVAPGGGSDPDQLVRSADLALYRAKSDERGTFRFFEQEMDTHMRARRALESDLRSALEADQLTPHYQPLLNLTTNRISGCEALLRWHHPVRGWVSPAEFIPAAEATGLIAPMGEWLLREACREAVNWPAETKVAVNLSPIQFKSGNILLAVVNALAASGLSASRLELEITESVLIADNAVARDILTQLHAMGVGIALDDFGTGYSSLSYLRSFPFNKIKIDRCFIGDLGDTDKNALAILRMVTQLGHALGMTVTAEGVETAEQLEIVRSEGCSEMQGYLLSPPIVASEIRLLMASALEHLTRAA